MKKLITALFMSALMTLTVYADYNLIQYTGNDNLYDDSAYYLTDGNLNGKVLFVSDGYIYPTDNSDRYIIQKEYTYYLVDKQGNPLNDKKYSYLNKIKGYNAYIEKTSDNRNGYGIIDDQ